MSSNTRPLNTRNVDSMAVIAKWVRRCGLPIAILAWIVVVLLILMGAAHVIHTLLILTVAALLAYAIAPAVKLLARVMPRFLAMIIVYLVILGVIGFLLYLIALTAIDQIGSLSGYIKQLLTPGKGGQLSPLEQTLRSLNISQSQIDSARNQLVTSIEGLSQSVVPILTGVIGAILDVVLVAVLSIYLLADGPRVSGWLRRNMPQQQQGRISFFMQTLQRIVGGYIRGQLLLCGIIGVGVGVGMQVIGVPYALLLGVLAFVLEFIPVLGTLVSGAICILLALTKGWIIALIVLAYFVVLHVLEGDVLGPRVVGKAIGLHPVVSLIALIAGAELFGIWGALFAAPIAGVLQALLVAIWSEWRELHPDQFLKVEDPISEKTEGNATDPPSDPEPVPKLLS